MLLFVRARVLFLLLAGVFANVAGVHVARADGSSPSASASASATSSAETDEERFRRLKAEGDRALAEGRLSDAIRAYNAARDIRMDSLTAGRMGLAISYFDDPQASEAAAMMLYEAVRDAAGEYPQEKDAFFAAYKRMRKLVCKVEVSTNEVHALIDVGHGFKQTLPAFFVFRKKGKGEAVAKLDGHQDIRKTWDCTGDHDIEIKFEFPPAEIASAKAITITEKAKETVKVVYVPIPAEQPTAKPESSAKRLSVLFGPNVVLGVAPSPAYGLSIAGAYKLGNWSAMFGARGAYAWGPIEGNMIDAFNFTGTLGPCFREQRFSACVFGSINMIKSKPSVRVASDFDVESQVTPGIGFGIGGRHALSKKIGFYINGDATILARDVELTFPQTTDSTIVWRGNQFLLAISLGMELAP